MLQSAQEERVLIDHYRSIGDNATADAIEEEFFGTSMRSSVTFAVWVSP